VIQEGWTLCNVFARKETSEVMGLHGELGG